MVRLRLRQLDLFDELTLPFQSHYGAIATRRILSNTVRESYLSIPLWCDCDVKKHTELKWSGKLSIPLWCDCDVELVGSLLDPTDPFNPTMVRLRQRLGE